MSNNGSLQKENSQESSETFEERFIFDESKGLCPLEEERSSHGGIWIVGADRLNNPFTIPELIQHANEKSLLEKRQELTQSKRIVRDSGGSEEETESRVTEIYYHFNWRGGEEPYHKDRAY